MSDKNKKKDNKSKKGSKKLDNDKKEVTKHDSFVKKIMESPAVVAEFLEEFMPKQYLDIMDLDSLQIEKESYVELRHEVAKKSCFPLLKRKPSLPRDDPRVLNKERT